MSLMANMNLQTTGSTGLSPSMQTYYDKRLLQNAVPVLVHQKYGQKRVIPKNGGKTVNFRKFTPFPALTTALTEGVVPDGQQLNVTQLTATVAQYGGYVAVSDLLDLTAIDPILDETAELLGNQAGLSIDTITRDVLVTGTNVQYANGKTARNLVANTDVLTTTEIRKAVRTLKKNMARPFPRNGKGYYVAIVGPDTVYDLQNDTLWQDVSKYSAAEQIFDGEIGKIFGVVFVETTNAKIFAGAGASGADVAATLIFGQDAYGVIDISGSGAIRNIVKPKGSAGTSDPLDQISTSAWKVEAYTAKILQELWMIRIEHGISA